MNKSFAVFGMAMLAASAAFAAGSGSDSEFAKKAAEGGMAEVAAGRLASTKGQSASVKSFGQRMVTDHSKANDELKAAAAKSGVTLPSTSSQKQKEDATKLAQMQGAQFDKEYSQMMVKDHEEDVALFQKEASSGSDPNLKAFAQKTLPTLQEHLKMAKDMESGEGKGSHASK
jgi:putative membrane protein